MTESSNAHSFIGNLVSIITPVYNAESYLRRCIESIVNQSYKNIEIIFINDGSTDNSGEICDAYAHGDPRINVIHSQNEGPSAARNKGIRNSTGNFIFFLDADDFIVDNAIESLVEGYNQHKVDMVIGDFLKIKDEESNAGLANIFSSSKLLTKQDIIECTRRYLKRPNRFELFSYSWGRLFKASIIRNNDISFNEALHTYEDVTFNFDYLKHTNEIFFIKETLYNHLVHDNYTSARTMLGDNPRKLFGYMEALENIGAFLKEANCDADIVREIGHAYVYLTIIQFVRTCGQVNDFNKSQIYRTVHGIVKDSKIKNNVQFYSASKGDSKILPILMKLGLVWPIIAVCKYKAFRRYRRRR